MGDDILQLIEDVPAVPIVVSGSDISPIKVLMVDDEEEVLMSTSFSLNLVTIDGHPIELITATNSFDGLKKFQSDPSIAIMLIDVVMESAHAGINLVDSIRRLPNGNNVRLILRTGQPGFSDEESTIKDHLVNGYLRKAELTKQRLVCAITIAYRDYKTISALEARLNDCRQRKLELKCDLVD